MGGAVSSGRDNNELVDNLMGSNYIRTRAVEQVFRSLDRADYMTANERDRAYRDLAWRSGSLHLSSPCIYSEVMEGLELKTGLSFLNVGSGTGYLSHLVGLIIGATGINHGVELDAVVVEYAMKKSREFLENSPTLDEFDLCEPMFYQGNGLCLTPLPALYDRVYCGAACPPEYENYFKQLIKVGGILVMPLNDQLLQVHRLTETEWSTRSLLNVTFATLAVPSKADAADHVRLDEQAPPCLQARCRSVVRAAMRAALLSKHPDLREPDVVRPSRKNYPKRICIPIEDTSDVEGLNELHDLDRASGAHEMNALLSLVVSMGRSRVAGALRFDPDPLDPADLGSAPDSASGSASDADADDSSLDSAPEQEADAPPDGDDRVETFGSIDDMNRAIHRVIRAVDGPNADGEPTRGRLCLSLEYDLNETDSELPPGHGVARPPGRQDLPAASPDPKGTAAQNGRDRKRHSRCDETVTKGAVETDVPSEVEICLGRDAGGSHADEMETESQRKSNGASASLSEPTSCNLGHQSKRHKFDSGLGEEKTPSSSSTPSKSGGRTDDDVEGSDSMTDDPDAYDSDLEDAAPRRRRQAARAAWAAAPTPERYASRRPPPGRDARRVRLSVLMKRGVRELPLPYALNKYINYQRCFEF